MADKLTYEELRLGEKAKRAFLKGKSLDFIKENCPVYLNTRPVYAGLNVTDLGIAAVLSGIPILLIGNTGCGKSQEARDFHNYYFNGAKQEGGEALTIEGSNELNIYADVFTYVDMEKGKRVLNENHSALYFDLEEFNRCPSPTQNQFYSIGNGRLIDSGISLHIGRNGYRACVATANFGNGEFQGTFDTDKALLNRFGVVLDFDYELFKPTKEDEMLINLLREADPGIKEAPRRDLSEKIIQAYNEISANSQNIGLEAQAAVNYLRFGLRNCRGPKSSDMPGEKEKTWPGLCQDCARNPDGKYLCSLAIAPQQRTIESLIKYSSALNFLAKLKNPRQKIDPVELVFKAFEITGAYQHILNPFKLRQDYHDAAPKMMQEVAQRLKADFRRNEDLIMTALENSQKGKQTKFCRLEDKIFAGYDELSQEELSGLSEEDKRKIQAYDPFTDSREDKGETGIGLAWVKDAVKLQIKLAELEKKKAEEEQENKNARVNSQEEKTNDPDSSISD